jgi:membrane protease YdiL (CAAX protease family)
MNNARRAAIIMTVIALVEGAPMASFALRPGGLALVGRWLGIGARPITPLAWGAAVAIALAYAAASMASLPAIREKLFTLNRLKLLGIGFALITGLFEEWFFRKWLMDIGASHGLSAILQVIGSGVIFGLAHAIWGLFGGNLRAFFTSMAFTTAMGLALAWLYVFAGRQVAPAVWSHSLINLIIEPWLLLGVLNLRRSAPAPDGAARPTGSSSGV